MKNILVIKAHPREKSFCNSLTNEYISGAKNAGNEVKIIELRNLNLEVFLKNDHSPSPSLTQDLLEAQKLISWADHLLFSYPTWWAAPPAILKLFIESVIEPGFAYKYLKPKGSIPRWEKFLSGKTAEIISTMDSPPFYMNLVLGDPGGKMMKATFNFVGIKLRDKHYFGSVKMSSKDLKGKWIKKAYQIGNRK